MYKLRFQVVQVKIPIYSESNGIRSRKSNSEGMSVSEVNSIRRMRGKSARHKMYKAFFLKTLSRVAIVADSEAGMMAPTSCWVLKHGRSRRSSDRLCRKLMARECDSR